VRLPANAPAGVTLVRMLDVSMRLVNITLDGGFRPESVALQALGRESSAALVRNSTIMQVADGLRAVNTTLVFFLNTFTDIQNDAVVVYELDLKGLNVAMNTPLLGDANRLATTGSNTFRNVGGFFIRNLNPNTTFAQNNDWGLETAQEVEAKMEGDVEFEPFLGQTNFFGSTVTVTLLDAATMLPVTGADLETIPFVGNAEESGEPGVYVFPLVPTGNYTVRAEADAYVPLTGALSVDDAVETVDYDLLPLDNPAVQSADQDADGRLNLFELIRVIQFLNSGALHCDDATEDGFAPGPGDTVSCDPHALDYNPQDWEVNLTEILRSIQFFNLGGYTYCPEMGTEDGFCPGP
jgi:hypothetical protein